MIKISYCLTFIQVQWNQKPSHTSVYCYQRFMPNLVLSAGIMLNSM